MTDVCKGNNEEYCHLQPKQIHTGGPRVLCDFLHV